MSTVRPWRFEVVYTKEDPRGKWYVCLHGPFAKPIGKKKRRVAGMSGDPVDSSSSITRPSQTPGPANPKKKFNKP